MPGRNEELNMRKKPVYVAITIFCCILAFTPSCTPVQLHQLRGDTSAPVVDDGSTSIVTDAENSDTGSFSATDTDNFIMTEAPVPRAADASIPGVTELNAPVTVLLDPITCHGRSLAHGREALELLDQGMIVWHLCYKTPTPMTSPHELASERAERVLLRIATTGSDHLLLVAPAPTSANPWTVSLLVALPVGMAPAFHGTVEYAHGRRLELVGADDTQEAPDIHGEMRTWRVRRSGSQDPFFPARICQRPTALTPDGAFFLPLDTCPGTTCPLLHGLACRDLSPR